MAQQVRPKDDLLKTCPNCEAIIPEQAVYCQVCGQKYTDGKIPLLDILRDFVEAVFNIDSSAYRTLWAIFVPGRLTTEFFRGRHKKFAPPLRLFILMAIFHLGVLAYLSNKHFRPQLEEMTQKNYLQSYHGQYEQELDSIQDQVTRIFDGNRTVVAAMDSIDVRIKRTERDSSGFGYFDIRTWPKLETRPLNYATNDLFAMETDDFLDKYGVEGLINRVQVRQFVRLRKDPYEFAQFVLGQFTWMVLLMMPAIALILKLLYIRRNRYFVEHLVFGFHYHAFAFLVLSIGMLIDQKLGPFTGIGMLLTLVYLYIAMIRFYGQGWFKTLVKFFILNNFYMIIFSVFLVLTLVIGAILF